MSLVATSLKKGGKTCKMYPNSKDLMLLFFFFGIVFSGCDVDAGQLCF